MARVTHVKHARQRYEMVPVLDAEGVQVQTPVTVSRRVRGEDGEYATVQVPKTTKTGRAVTRGQVVQDRSRPLPNLRCDYPGCQVDGGEILPGTAYKHITPRSGPFGGVQKNRHAAHPSWQVWEYSGSRAAQIARTQHDMHQSIDTWAPDSPDDWDDMLSSLEEQAQGELDDSDEAVSNMPEHLQDGSAAAEIRDALEAWVEGFSQVDRPDDADALLDCEECEGTHEVDCDQCSGTGEVENEGWEGDERAEDGDGGADDCDACNGTGKEDCGACEEGKTDALDDEWVEEARGVLREAVDAFQG